MMHVSFDRMNNALWLLGQIKELAATGSSCVEFIGLLNTAKKTALEWDAEIDKNRFSFFRRNRFGSRYIGVLDDLRERALYTQNQEDRQQSCLQIERMMKKN
jgi:hypothetical protein